MDTALLILLGSATLLVLSFLVVLSRLSVEDADWWLKALLGVVGAFTFLAATFAIFTGHFVNKRQGEKMVTLETEMEEQRERAARAETELLELKEKIADRHLSTEQRSGLAEHLRNAPKAKLEIIGPVGAPEPFQYAKEIASVFEESGWETEVTNRTLFMGNSPMGLILKIYASEEAMAGKDNVSIKVSGAVNALASGFEKVGLSMAREGYSKLAEGQIVLVVGFKPGVSAAPPQNRARQLKESAQ